MRNFFFPALAMFICVLASAAPSEGDAIPSPEEFSKRVVSAHNWKTLLASVDSRLPLKIQKELTDISDRTAFPNITFFRSEIHIKDENGEHVTVRLESGGKVFFDNKEWTPNPLAKTSDEVDRLQDFLFDDARPKHSLLDRLFLSAYADSSGQDTAYAGQAIAIGWAAEQCRGAELSKSQKETCTLMGAGTYSDLPGDKNFWLPVHLDCPASNDQGVLTAIDENQLGQARKTVVSYEAGKATRVEVTISELNNKMRNPKNKKFVPVSDNKIIDVEFDTEAKLDWVTLAGWVAKGIGPLNSKVCKSKSSAAKPRYDDMAAENRNLLHKGAPDELLNDELFQDARKKGAQAI
jgi:hypothetical protein